MIAKTETLGGCKILRVSGRIDFESALDFEHHINAMIQEAGDCYIIELSEVELLSSAGLRVMLSTAKRVAHRNASLALAAPSQVVRQVFEISHFNLLFKIFPSVPAAIAALKGATEVIPPEDVARNSLLSPKPTKKEEESPTELVIPNVEPASRLPTPQKTEVARQESMPSVVPSSPRIERTRVEPPNPIPPPLPVVETPSVRLPVIPVAPSLVPGPAETPTVAPLSIPPVTAEPTEAPAATALPKPAPPRPPRQTPPPLPTANQSAPITPPRVPLSATQAGSPVTRREPKYPASLEVRAEGTSYPCKDGDVIGTIGGVAQPYFSQITNLAPRHLLIGQLDGRWFVFTPQNVQHPFIMDGVVLRAGERKMLQYVDHQVEFSGYVFGFRLVDQPPKESFFGRLFGRKR
ncbi:MAG: anti-sigma factor antagonist [Verrucomicrobiota bacterium]|jgi:anti-anti-sigma factor